MDGNKISGVATIKEIFKFDFDDKTLKSFVDAFEDKISLAIPKYQREYTWKNENIKIFVNDIYKNAKFLGIITLEKNKKQSTLDIVDGQQRITTLILFMLSLYNKLIEIGETVKADNIKDLLEKDNKFIFRNDSISDFVKKQGNRYIIDIDDEKDIYRQKNRFYSAYKLIGSIIDEKCKRVENEYVEYDSLVKAVDNIFDCEMVLFINTKQNNEGSIEEIYIDINDKAQELSEEDIFKGYCFSKIKDKNQQEELKNKWINIKESFFKLYHLKINSLNKLLHFYLQIETCSNKINQRLYFEGKHYLNDLRPTEIMKLLDKILEFENNLVLYENEISDTRYKFENIVQKDRRIESDLNYLKSMSFFILHTSQNIYKLPFYHYINTSICKKEKIDYIVFKSFVRSYYIYAYIYTEILKQHVREGLAIDVLKSINANKKIIDTLVCEIQTIINKQYLGISIKKSNLRMLYSIIDTASSTKNSEGNIQEIKLKSYTDETYEHFVVNKSLKTKWVNSDGTIYDFDEADLYSQVKDKKEHEMNFILIPIVDNGAMENLDIVRKIEFLESNSLKRRKHVAIFTEYIKRLQSFKELKHLKNDNENRAVILEAYKEFLEEYFRPENIKDLVNQLDEAFKNTINSL